MYLRLSFVAISLVSFFTSSVHMAEVQNLSPLSPTSKYSCLINGSKSQVVIPNSKCFKTTTFPKTKDSIKEAQKVYVLQRATLRGIRSDFVKQKANSKEEQKAFKQICKKYGVELPETTS